MPNYALYPSALGGLRFTELLDVARSNGMTVIDAWKVGMCVHASIAVSGTQRQKAATVAKWSSRGNNLMRRSFPVWKINCNIPRDRWFDVEEAERKAAWQIHSVYSRMEKAA